MHSGLLKQIQYKSAPEEIQYCLRLAASDYEPFIFSVGTNSVLLYSLYCPPTPQYMICLIRGSLYFRPLIFFIFVTEKHWLAIFCQPHFTDHPVQNPQTSPASIHRNPPPALTMQNVGDLLSLCCTAGYNQCWFSDDIAN